MKTNRPNITALLFLGLLFSCFVNMPVNGQEVIGPHRFRWIRVGTLQSWFSNSGAEEEYGRRGRACCQNTDQTDQMVWDALFEYQARTCSRGLWIGCKNFQDPKNGKFYTTKVISAGPRFADITTLTMPVMFKMVGKFTAPQVYVDGLPASDNLYNDEVDELDPAMKADRMVVCRFHTPLGVTVTRKVYGFSQQYHDNYFIFDYVIRNTGIIDLDGNTIQRTLEGVILHFQERTAPGWTSFRGGWAVAGDLSWGSNTVHQVIGTNPNASDFMYRAFYSWYHPHSRSPGFEEDWGNPDYNHPRILGAPAFIGGVTLHADASPANPSDDLRQPFTTAVADADHRTSSNIDQFDTEIMAMKYDIMSNGHLDVTNAVQVGDQFGDAANTVNWSQAQSYGPYNLAPGDSIHVVLAEGVDGLDRALSQEIGTRWYNDAAPFNMPDGATSSDRNAYKKAWVWTAEDSMMQMFGRITANYNSGFNIPEPPPPPDVFEIKSGGDKITLSWSENAAEYEYFDGYRLYRAVNRPDTLYEMIYSCGASDVQHMFEDKTARRGFDYFYYIVTKDDGSLNDISPGVPLVSSKFWTLTNTPAYLRRPAESALDSIIIVPNPFHIQARTLQFGNETPDRIAFFGLPKKCLIKIYTERGDLVKQIDHVDGSGDELWDSVTSSLQIVVSGVYIAYFEVTEDILDDDTGAVVLKKGQTKIRKFTIIR